MITSTPPAADSPFETTGKFADYLELTKPRLSLLSVITALVGYLVVKAPWDWSHFLATMA
jgi:heme o synthase